MRDIIENQLKLCDQSNSFLAQDWQVLPLQIDAKLFMRAVFKLGNLDQNGVSSNRNFRLSVEVERDSIKTIIQRGESPFDSVELKASITSDEFNSLPTKVKDLLETQESVKITGINVFQLNSSRRVRATQTEKLFFIVGYSRAVLVSASMNINQQVISSIHGANHFPGNGGQNAAALNGVVMDIVFNANKDYSTESIAEITFNKGRGKKVFSKAGRSKPQGDLILYFGGNSCLAKGVNGAGAETLKLQNAASLPELNSYDSSVEGWAKVTLNYPLIYDKVLSAAKGFLAPTGADLSFGVDENLSPYVVSAYSIQRGGNTYETTSKYTFRGYPGEESNSLPEDLGGLSILDLKSKTTVQPPNPTIEATQVASVKKDTGIQSVEKAITVIPEGQLLLNQWRDSYVAYNSARGRSVTSHNPLEHFNAFLMHQIELGNEIDSAHYELYNTLK